MLTVSNITGPFIAAATLDQAWPKQDRLLLAVATSIFGCIMNGFFIASFFTDIYLKRIGFVYQAFVGISDLIVSMLVIPTIAVILLSGHGDNDAVCYTLQFMIEASTNSYSAFFAMMSLETYYRIRMNTDDYNVFISRRIGCIATLTFVASFATAAVGVYMGLDYDSCYRKHAGNLTFRFVTNIIFHLIPGLVTIYTSVSACLDMKHRADIQVHYRRSSLYKNDRYAHYMNIAAYLLYVLAWLPYVIAVNDSSVDDVHFYVSVWIGVIRSVITSFLYGLLDRNFRRAFARLFNYCFCKAAITNHMVRRHRRAIESRAAAGDMRLLMMQQIANSPRRTVLLPRETQA